MEVGRLSPFRGNRLLKKPRSSRDSFFAGLTVPVIVLQLAISAFPLIYTIWVSFTNENLRTSSTEFVGIHNYLLAFGDGDFWAALGRTVIFVLAAIMLRVVGGIGVAQLLNIRMFGRIIPRTAILIPWVISEVVVAAIWLWILDHQTGVFNGLLSQLGIGKVGWLANPNLAMMAVIFVVFWKNIAFSFLLYLGALQKISPELYEASKVDGATQFDSFRYITLPLLRPTIMLNIIMVSITCLNYFSLVYALTGGGPLYSTELIGLYMYRQSFFYLNLGYGAALATIIFIINLILTYTYYKLLKSEQYF